MLLLPSQLTVLCQGCEVWRSLTLFSPLILPGAAKVCSNLMILCLVLKLDDRDLDPGGKWPNFAKRGKVSGLKWEIIWKGFYLRFWFPGGGHCWDSIHFRNTWVLTFSWCKTEKGVGGRANSTDQGQDCWWWHLWGTQTQGVMNCRWWPMLPAWCRHQLGDVLQGIPIPLPARKSFTWDYEYGSLYEFFLINNHFSHFSWLPSSCPPLKPRVA